MEDESKKREAVNEFNKVADASSEFLKAIFPHAYSLKKKITSAPKKSQETPKK